MFGARKGTQVVDVAHAAQLHMQKSGHNLGEGGFAVGPGCGLADDGKRCIFSKCKLDVASENQTPKRSTP